MAKKVLNLAREVLKAQNKNQAFPVSNVYHKRRTARVCSQLISWIKTQQSPRQSCLKKMMGGNIALSPSY